MRANTHAVAGIRGRDNFISPLQAALNTLLLVACMSTWL